MAEEGQRQGWCGARCRRRRRRRGGASPALLPRLVAGQGRGPALEVKVHGRWDDALSEQGFVERGSGLQGGHRPAHAIQKNDRFG